MSRKVVTLILGTAILFLWNALSWMVLPLHDNSMNTIPEGIVDAEMWKGQMPEDGVYQYPGMPEGEEGLEVLKDQLASGPRIALMVYKSGSTVFMDPMNFVYGLVFNFLTVWALLFVVERLANKSPGNILGVSIILAAIIALMSDLPMMNWFIYPGEFVFANILDYVVSFALLGLLMGYYTFRQKSKIP